MYSVEEAQLFIYSFCLCYLGEHVFTFDFVEVKDVEIWFGLLTQGAFQIRLLQLRVVDRLTVVTRGLEGRICLVYRWALLAILTH